MIYIIQALLGVKGWLCGDGFSWNGGGEEEGGWGGEERKRGILNWDGELLICIYMLYLCTCVLSSKYGGVQ